MTTPPPGSRRARTAVALAIASVLIASLTVAAVATRPAAPAAVTNQIIDAEGGLALPMPRLAQGFTLAANDDGSTDVSFAVTLAVYNTTTNPVAPGAKPDAAIVHTTIADAMTSLGPFRLQPSFSAVQLDQDLDARELTRTYTTRIPPAQTAFLREKGLGSPDPAQHAAALRHIDVAVQHIRDFKAVDGEWDWQQGRAWTAADQPVQASQAIVEDSTISVTNDTGLGLFDLSDPDVDPTQAAEGGDRAALSATGAFATNLSLSGQPVQCIEQGDGSDPQGFSLLNGWDIEDDLPPGILPPGATITQQVNAADGLGDDGLGVAEDATTVAVLSGLAALGVATPGVESGITAGAMLGMGLSELSGAAALATGIPIGAILELGYALYEELEDSCANYANIFNLTAAEPAGSSASYSWGDQTNGLWQVYDSASVGGSPVTDNVSLAPSTGIASFLDPQTQTPTTVNPYLTQVPTLACGTACPSGVNNEISLAWSVADPCPQADLADCAPTPGELAGLPEVDIPGTDLCGPGNSLCPPLAAPIPTVSQTGSLQDDAEEDPAFAVLASITPPSPINAIATVGETPYFGAEDGTISTLQSGRVLSTVADATDPINAMAATGAGLVVGTASGQVLRWDGGQIEVVQAIPEASIQELVVAGGATWVATSGGSLFSIDGSGDLTEVFVTFGEVSAGAAGQPVTSLAANGTALFAGLGNGMVISCQLADCAGSGAVLHDAGFDSAANALTTLGGTLYVGLDNGAVAQIDTQDGWVTMAQGPGERANTIGAMTVVNGNVYLSGCLSTVDPVTDDMLGVAVLYEMDQAIDEGGPIGQFRPGTSDTCYDFSSADSEYQGYDTSAAAIATSSPTSTPSDPAVVYQAFTIDSGSFLYALENLAPYDAGSGVCIASAGGCPGPPPAAPAPSAPPPLVGALSDLPGPQVTSSCAVEGDGYVEAGDPDPLTTIQPAATIPGDGFQLTAPTQDGQACTTTWAWNLANVGSYPYALWQANAYLDQATAPGTSISLGVAGAHGQASTPTANGVAPAGPAQVGPGGTQLAVPLTGLTALTLTVTSPAGATGPVVVDLSNDLLTQVGMATPPPAPLAPPSAPCDYPRAALASAATFLWLLNDTSTVAADASGHGNDGTITAPAAYDVEPGPTATCPQAGALRFDGSSTRVTAPAGVSTASDALTVTAWVQVGASPPGELVVLADGDPGTTGQGVALALQGDGSGGATGGSFTVGTAGGVATAAWDQPLRPGAWYQVVGTYDGTTATAYLNGQPVATATTSGPVLAGSDPVTVGASPAGTSSLPGLAADAALVPQAMTGAQVQSLYSGEPVAGPDAPTTSTTTTTGAPSTTTGAAATTSTTTGPASTTSSTTSTTVAPGPPPPVPPTPCSFTRAALAARASALWLLNDVGDQARDYSGHGNTATIVTPLANDVTPGPVASCPGSGGVAFAGPGGVYPPASLEASFTSTTTLTVVGSFQVAASAGPGTWTLVGNSGTSDPVAGFSLGLELGAGGVAGASGAFTVGNTIGPAQARWSQPLAPDTWHQYVGVYDGTSVAVYLDGLLVGSGDALGIITTGPGPLVVGTSGPPGAGQGWPGVVADVAIIPSALSATQVGALWAAMG